MLNDKELDEIRRNSMPVERPQYVCLCGMVYEHPMQRTACMVQHEAEETPAPCPKCGEEVPCIPCESLESSDVES